MIFVPTLSVAELERTVGEIVSDGIILEPELPAALLADRLIAEADGVFIAELGHSLIVAALSKRIRRARSKKRTLERPKGFEHLPFRIKIYGHKTVRLDHANTSALTQFCKIRSGEHKTRRSEDLVLKEALEMNRQVGRASRKKRGITAGEVLSFSFDEPETPNDTAHHAHQC